MITDSNRLYTWGASPQLIRLLNQSRKRARMAQKTEDPKPAASNEAGEKSTDLSNGDVPSGKEATPKTETENQEVPMPETNGPNVAEHTESLESNTAIDATKSFASKITASNLQDKIKHFIRTEIKQPIEKLYESDAQAKINSEFYLDDEYTDHFLPTQVDTSDVVGEMIQVGV